MKKIVALLVIGLVLFVAPAVRAEEAPPPTSTIQVISGPANAGTPGACLDVYDVGLPECDATDVCSPGGSLVYNLTPCEFDKSAYSTWCERRDNHPACQAVPSTVMESPRPALPATGVRLVITLMASLTLVAGLILKWLSTQDSSVTT